MTRAWSLDPGRVGFISWLFSLWPKGSCESQLWVSHLENRAGAVLSIKWRRRLIVVTLAVLTMYTQGN